jgi:hypothetical protein
MVTGLVVGLVLWCLVILLWLIADDVKPRYDD